MAASVDTQNFGQWDGLNQLREGVNRVQNPYAKEIGNIAVQLLQTAFNIERSGPQMPTTGKEEYSRTSR